MKKPTIQQLLYLLLPLLFCIFLYFSFSDYDSKATTSSPFFFSKPKKDPNCVPEQHALLPTSNTTFNNETTYTHFAIYILVSPLAEEYERYKNIVIKSGIDVLIGCYKTDCTRQYSNHSQLYLKYIPETTWTSGRNALLQKVLEIEKEEHKRYQYLIFQDNDFWPKLQVNETFVPVWKQHQIECGLNTTSERVAFDYYECLLQKYEPPLAAPFLMPHSSKSFFGEPVFSTIYLDAASNAFHRLTLPILLPYITEYDDISWWISQAILLKRMLCFYGFVLQFDWIGWDDQLSPNNHGSYPRSDDTFDIADQHQEKYIPEMFYTIDTNVNRLLREGSLSPFPVSGLQWVDKVPAVCLEKTMMDLEHVGFDLDTI